MRVSPEEFYARSERLRKAKVAAREAAEKIETDAHVQRLLREQEAAFQSASEKVFVAQIRMRPGIGHMRKSLLIALVRKSIPTAG